MKREKLLALVVAGGLLAVLVASSLRLGGERCEVCVTFQGRTNCATASGSDRDEALRTAVDTACAPISAGMTESLRCANTPPDRVTWKD